MSCKHHSFKVLCCKARQEVPPAPATCPGCHKTVDVDSDVTTVLRTQRKTWHRDCYDRLVVNRPHPVTFCPWCSQGFTATDNTLVSQNNRRWHRECWQRRKREQDQATMMKFFMSMVCPGCQTSVPRIDSLTLSWHLSEGGYWWCDKCYNTLTHKPPTIDSGRFQVGTVPCPPETSQSQLLVVCV